MKFYQIEHGEVITTAAFIGEYKTATEALKAVWDSAGSGTEIYGFADSKPAKLEEGIYGGYDVLSNPEDAEEIYKLERSDGTVEGVPECVWAYGEVNFEPWGSISCIDYDRCKFYTGTMEPWMG